MNYTQDKSYNRFMTIISDVRKAAAGLKSRMELSAQTIVDAMARLRADLKLAQDESDRLQAQLVAEEINGKPSAKTAKAAAEAADKVARCEQSLKALSRSAGVAVIHLEKKAESLNIHLQELNNEKRSTEVAPDFLVSASARKDRIKKLDNEIKPLAVELDEVNGLLKTLGAGHKEAGSVIRVDADTQAEIKAALQLAGNGYAETLQLKAGLVSEIEAKREQLERLKEELGILEEVQGSLDPEVIADQLYGSEVEYILYSGQVTKIESPVVEHRNREHMNYLLKSHIRNMAREYSANA